MKVTKVLFGVIALASATLSAGEKGPHNLYFKPLAQQSKAERVEGDNTSVNPEGDYKSGRQYGFDAGYEYSAQDDVYFNAHASSLFNAEKKEDGSFDKLSEAHTRAAGDIGYTFGVKGVELTPFVGGGFDSRRVMGEEEKTERKNGWLTQGGLRVSLPVFDALHIGAKGTGFLFPKNFSSDKRWGYEVATPISYEADAWNVAVAPFMRKERREVEKATISQRDLGASVNVGLRF